MPPLDSDAARWFATELQPHLPMLRAWVKSQFPAARDVDDAVQEAVMRVLHAHTVSPVRSPKAYLYVVARNLALSSRTCRVLTARQQPITVLLPPRSRYP